MWWWWWWWWCAVAEEGGEGLIYLVIGEIRAGWSNIGEDMRSESDETQVKVEP